MRRFKQLFPILLILLLAAVPLQAQTTVDQTVTSGAVTIGASNVTVASATGITASTTMLYIDREAMDVVSVTGTSIRVIRGTRGTRAAAHLSGAVVFAGPFSEFVAQDPLGTCTRTTLISVPVINIANGNIWNCDSNDGIWQATNLTDLLGNVPYHYVNDAAYTAGLYDTFVHMRHATTGRTITLPSITKVYGKIMIIKSETTQTITIAGSNGQGVGTNDGATTTLSTTGAVLRLLAVGGWWITF